MRRKLDAQRRRLDALEQQQQQQQQRDGGAAAHGFGFGKAELDAAAAARRPEEYPQASGPLPMGVLPEAMGEPVLLRVEQPPVELPAGRG
jgi:hypothetical protein